MSDTEGAAVPERLLITRTTTDDGVCVVTLAGEVDLDGSAQLRDVLLSGLEGARGTVVDLADVAFMDSSGINVFIAAHQAAEAGGGWLRLAAPRQAVRRVLQLVGVDILIACYPTVEQALAD
ncbi:STAS domain-containing protein [Streptomyces sp. ISL-12]|uniref:STAS domain-containing protein n=1 Tax=Streptomyces sp. ISL-12 TaxID=2819177 RepID=UPI001BE9F4AE|nr:STAS domain-containing protein [Streptomyces sp. ISL-12]MBT2411280.1 STAS domain-containing protein [Streptomyces sp. ISL-12]